MHTLAIERDPIEVLRMGIPFDTCLSLEGGVNAASTVVNAADANKRVLYLRDARGSIVARKLVAVSREYGLIGYRVYIAAKEHRAEILAAFRDMCARISEAALLPLAADGKPKQIHPGFWYDDGAEPFDGAAVETPVAAYCRSLGMPVPSEVDDDLRTEARAFEALQRADVEEACAALGEGGWSWAHKRAAAWVLPRIDRARLGTLARRSGVLADEALQRARQQGLGPMLRVAGQLSDWRVVEGVISALQGAPGDAEAALGVVDAGFAFLRAHPKVDADELPHRTCDLVPALARWLSVRAAFALCDRVDPLWKRVGERQSECVECMAEARSRLVDVIASAYAGARDPEAVIERLGGRSGPLARRAALAIAARYALHPDATDPTLPSPRLEPVRPCPEAVRALVKLRRREPGLEGEPDLFAALLRQAGGAPRGVALPAPKDPPFAALGDLLAQLDLADLLAPWSGRDTPVGASWRDPWELYFHRRAATGLRARLADEARSAAAGLGAPGRPGDPAEPSAAYDPLVMLAQLGERAPFDRWMAEVSGRGLEARRARARLERQRAIARETAGQLASTRAEDPLAAELARRAEGRPKQLAEGHDQGLLLASIARIERHIFGQDAERPAADEDGTLALAYRLVTELDRSASLRNEIVTELAARREGHFCEEDRVFVSTWLASLPQYRRLMICPPRVVLGLLADPGLRLQVIARLVKDGIFEAERTLRAIELLARNTNREQNLEGFFEELCRAFVEQSTAHVTSLREERMFRPAVRVLLERGTLARVLQAYGSLTDHGEMAAFLEMFAASPLRAQDDTRAAVRALRGDHDQPRTSALEWLEACLEGAAQGPSSRREPPSVARRKPSPPPPPSVARRTRARSARK